MRIVHVNDVLTLDDDNEYLVLKILDLPEGNFYLLSKLDEDEEMTDEVLIVTENSDNTLSPVEDENLLRKYFRTIAIVINK